MGLLVTGLPFSGLAITRSNLQEEVLSNEIEMVVTPIPELYDLPQPSPTAEPTILPSPTVTPSPKPTVKPDPTSTPDVWSPAVYEPFFTQYANTYGVDKNVLERLANCESHYNPSAISGVYVGMFQFGPVTWQKYRGMMGLSANLELRLSVEESIRTAAYAISVSGTGMWPRCL